MTRRRGVLVFLAGAVVAGGAGLLAVPGTAGAWAAPPGAVRAAGVWGKAIEVPGLAALNKGALGAQVLSVSCASPGSCAAGGYYTDGSGHGQGFVASQQHGRWGKAIEVPGLAALNKGGDAQVVQVSCGSAGNCAATGDYRDGEQGFVVVERNGRWGRATNESGLPTPDKGRLAAVNSLSCGSADTCAAAGSYSDRRHHQQGFVAVERRGRWGKAIEVPGLAALNKGGDTGVGSVSCASAGNCAAVGGYTDRRGIEQGFIASERHGRWGKAITLRGLAARDTGSDAIDVRPAVSCASAGNCVAAGNYTNRDVGDQGFVVVERNGRWGKATEVPGLGALNAGGFAEVNSVSCAPAGRCTAGGDYIYRRGEGLGFVTQAR